MKFFVINGPNLNMLGIREPAIYGKTTYADLVRLVEQAAKELQVEVEILQSNHEGTLVDEIQRAYYEADGIVINPAAYTHTSVAVLRRSEGRGFARGGNTYLQCKRKGRVRQISYAGQACFHTVMGEGIEGYRTAMRVLKEKLTQQS